MAFVGPKTDLPQSAAGGFVGPENDLPAAPKSGFVGPDSDLPQSPAAPAPLPQHQQAAVGNILAAEADPLRRDLTRQRLAQLPNLPEDDRRVLLMQHGYNPDSGFGSFANATLKGIGGTVDSIRTAPLVSDIPVVGLSPEQFNQGNARAALALPSDGLSGLAGQGIGSAAPFMAANLLPGGRAITTAMGALSGMGQTRGDIAAYEQQTGTTVSPGRKAAAVALGGLVEGGTELASAGTSNLIGKSLGRRLAGKSLGSMAGQMATKGLANVATNAAEEGAAQVGYNAIAKGFYDPQRNLGEGVQDSMIAGGFGGIATTPLVANAAYQERQYVQGVQEQARQTVGRQMQQAGQSFDPAGVEVVTRPAGGTAVTAEKLATRMGAEHVWVKGIGVNGFMDPDSGRIFLNADKPQQALAAITAHELTHTLEQEQPQAFSAFVQSNPEVVRLAAEAYAAEAEQGGQQGYAQKVRSDPQWQAREGMAYLMQQVVAGDPQATQLLLDRGGLGGMVKDAAAGMLEELGVASPAQKRLVQRQLKFFDVLSQYAPKPAATVAEFQASPNAIRQQVKDAIAAKVAQEEAADVPQPQNAAETAEEVAPPRPTLEQLNQQTSQQLRGVEPQLPPAGATGQPEAVQLRQPEPPVKDATRQEQAAELARMQRVRQAANESLRQVPTNAGPEFAANLVEKAAEDARSVPMSQSDTPELIRQPIAAEMAKQEQQAQKQAKETELFNQTLPESGMGDARQAARDQLRHAVATEDYDYLVGLKSKTPGADSNRQRSMQKGVTVGSRVSHPGGDLTPKALIDLDGARQRAAELPDDHPAQMALANVAELEQAGSREAVKAFKIADLPDGAQVEVRAGVRWTVNRDGDNITAPDGRAWRIAPGTVDNLYGRRVILPSEQSLPDVPISSNGGVGRGDVDQNTGKPFDPARYLSMQTPREEWNNLSESQQQAVAKLQQDRQFQRHVDRTVDSDTGKSPRMEQKERATSNAPSQAPAAAMGAPALREDDPVAPFSFGEHDEASTNITFSGKAKGRGPRYEKSFEWSEAKRLASLMRGIARLNIYDQAQTGSIYGMLEKADGSVMPVRIADHPVRFSAARLARKARNPESWVMPGLQMKEASQSTGVESTEAMKSEASRVSEQVARDVKDATTENNPPQDGAPFSFGPSDGKLPDVAKDGANRTTPDENAPERSGKHAVKVGGRYISMDDIRFRSSRSGRLGDIIDAPKLFEAAPWLKDYKLSQGTGGGSLAGGKQIFINSFYDRRELVHELQHAIQDHEQGVASKRPPHPHQEEYYSDPRELEAHAAVHPALREAIASGAPLEEQVRILKTILRDELSQKAGVLPVPLRSFEQSAPADSGGDAAFSFGTDQTQTPEFRRWFGQSKVVDGQGKPLVVYHQTGAKFNKFNPKKAAMGGTFWFTSSKAALESGEIYSNGRGQIMDLYLSIKNPAGWKEYERLGIWELKSRGYDGVALPDGDETTYIAFSPTQIKSATANRGSFDPENPDIRYSFGGSKPTPGQNYTLPEESGLDLLRRKWQDEFLPLRRTQEALAQQGGRVSDASDAYLRQTLFHGRVGDRHRQIESTFVKPIVRQMNDAGLSVEDVDEYLTARHASERNATIAARGGVADGSGMSDAEARRILAKWASNTAIADIATRVRRLNRQTLEHAVADGLVSRQQANDWEAQWQDYVPLRTADEEGRDSRPGQGFNVRGKEFKSATGRTSEADSPLVFSILQAQEKAVRGEKNRVGQSLLKLVQDNPDPDLWSVDATPSQNHLNAQGQVQSGPDPRYQTRDNVVSVKVDGKAHLIEFKGEAGQRLAGAVKKLGASDTGFLIRALGSVTAGYRMLQTSLNLDFLLPNQIRDLMTANANLSSEQSGKLARAMNRNVIPAVRAVWDVLGDRNAKRGSRLHDAMREYLAAGGKVDGYSLQSFEATQKQLAALLKDANPTVGRRGLIAIRKSGEFIDRLNGAMENATRLAAYAAARNAGMSSDRAAALAKNLTVNFNRKGEYGYTLNALYMFSNAGIQGNVRVLQALKGPRGKKIAGSIAMAGLAYGLAAPFLFGRDDQDREVWDTIPDSLKQRNILIPTGGGKYAKVPMPYGFNVLFNTGRLLAETLRRPERAGRNALAAADALLNAFNPLGNDGSLLQTLAPTLLDPVVQQSENKDWTGRPIVPEQSPFGPQKPDSQLARRDTSAFAKAAAGWLNAVSGGDAVTAGKIDVSPATLDHWIGWAAGGAGRFAWNALNAPANLAGEEVQLNRLPIAGRFAGKVNEPGVNAREFYQLKREAEQAHQQWQTYRKMGEFQKATERYRNNQKLIGLRGRMDALAERVQRLEALETKANDPKAKAQYRRQREQAIAQFLKSVPAEIKAQVR
jgi:hypothetical protein